MPAIRTGQRTDMRSMHDVTKSVLSNGVYWRRIAFETHYRLERIGLTTDNNLSFPSLSKGIKSVS